MSQDLTLEKLKVVEQLQQLKTQVDQLAILREQYHLENSDKMLRLQGSLDKILELIEGNGKPGLKVRIDRLEQVQRQAEWAYKTVIAICVLLALQQVAEWIMQLTKHGVL